VCWGALDVRRSYTEYIVLKGVIKEVVLAKSTITFGHKLHEASIKPNSGRFQNQYAIPWPAVSFFFPCAFNDIQRNRSIQACIGKRLLDYIE
jgi:hypothetical protein